LRQALVDDGRLKAETANLQAIRRWADDRPGEVQKYIHRNPRYVFFTPIAGNPKGSLNVEVTARRTLATDKTLFPRASLVYVDAKLGRNSRNSYHQFMLDQDTGGAIRTAGRADIYLGTGASAERRAGSTQIQGQLYYLFLKRSRR
jgi:membrane-bound lytic murein transglycosylase A